MNSIVRITKIRKLRKILQRYPTGRVVVTLADMYDEPLTQEGWVSSVRTNAPTDKDGNEIPWFSFSSIKFLEPRIKKEFSVFEYGSGNSTIWFSRLSKRVVSVEHDNVWYTQIKDKLQEVSNVAYYFRELKTGEYQKEILNYKAEFDLIILDGRERVQCCLNAVEALKPEGVIIWDNSDRERYTEGYEFLFSHGFKRLDFWGIGPSNHRFLCTSVFYREGNCLDL